MSEHYVRVAHGDEPRPDQHLVLRYQDMTIEDACKTFASELCLPEELTKGVPLVASIQEDVWYRLAAIYENGRFGDRTMKIYNLRGGVDRDR